MEKIIISLFVAIISLSCNSTDPEIKVPERKKSFIEAADVSCDEIWLKLEVGDIDLPAEGVIRIDGIKDKPVLVTTKDTILYIDSLEVNRNYKFQVILLNQGQTLISNEATAKTLDTTSHNFTWQTFEFGEHSHCVLFDVAIIDENNIWAVGEIYMNDSLGNPDPQAYNAVHWDGDKWELKRILYKGGFWAIRTIFAFNSNDIWFSGYMRYLNGQFIELQIPDILMGWRINKLWGTNSSDLYAVGNGGNIVQYNGSVWTKIESGTSLDIYDIWGDYNKSSNSYEILLIAANHLQGPERKILSLKSNVVKELSTTNIPMGSLHGVWFKNSKSYYAVGSGIYTKRNINEISSWINIHIGLTQYYIYGIAGTDYNDIFLCGSYGETLHFNGKTWKTFRNTPGFYKNEFINAAAKGNTVIVVGCDGYTAFIALGKRD